jgi:hypothetical protein
MPSASSSPVLRRWELAARLRALRLEAGRSIDDAAAELMCSVAKISRMETAGRGVQPRDIRDLCMYYGVANAVRDELMAMAAEARKPGWWQEFPTMDDYATTYIGLEAAASHVLVSDAMRMPGLLQTPEFTQALLTSLRPEGEFSLDWVSDTVAVRQKRQERVISGELHLHAVIDETAFARPVGGPEVMAAQIERVIQEAQRPNVTIQVIPFSRGAHPGIEGSFTLLSLPAGRIDDVIFVEGLLGNFTLDKETEVQRYRVIFEDLAHRFALPPEESLEWLASQPARRRTTARSRRAPRAG